MDDTTTPAAGADSAARDEGFSTVAEGVAELERREKARRAEKAAARQSEGAGQDDDAEGDDAGERDTQRPADRRAERRAESRAADDGDDDDAAADVDDDGADDQARKRRASGDDDGEGDGEGDDRDADDGDEDDDDKPARREAPPAKIKLNLGDREVEATPDEVSTYVRQAQTERQQVAQGRQQLTQYAQGLQQQSQQLAEIAQSLIGSEPDLSLAQSDPGAYIAQQALHKQRLQLVQHLREQSEKAAHAAQAQQQQAFAQHVERERAALLKAMPELADEAKLSAFSGRIAKVAQRYGISPQELGGTFDHRSYLMLRDLGRLADMEDAQSKNREKVREKLRNAPPLQSPKSGATQRPRDTKDIRERDAKKAFLKSGRTDRDLRRYLARTSPD